MKNNNKEVSNSTQLMLHICIQKSAKSSYSVPLKMICKKI